MRRYTPFALATIITLTTVTVLAQTPPTIIDYTDPTYGGKIRQLRKDDGHEHNFYYYRDPWNADGSYLLGIQSDLQQKNWHIVLYDGEGHFIKDLFSIEQYDWRLCWDRKDPDLFYTWKGSDLFRFRVKAGRAELMKSFKPLWLMVNGPSVNQEGDRILVATSDKSFRSYHLPDMSDERTFKPEIPAGTQTGWDKPRFTGYRNTIDVAFRSQDSKTQGILVYDDTGKLAHRFASFGGGGHCAFSPDGQVAYFFMPNYPRNDGKDSLDIHVVRLDGTDDRVVFSVPRAQSSCVQNLHLSWPAKVNGWFLASFFHFPNMQQPTYAPPYDEILQINLDGKSRYLARTGSNYSRGAGRGSSTDLFWAMPLAAPSADGRRISFNSNHSGTIDQCILFTDGAAAVIASPARAQQGGKHSGFLELIASGKTVMWIGAHPDDEIISAPLLARAADHTKVCIVSLTKGDAGENKLGGPANCAALGEIRVKELAASCKVLGAEMRVFGFHDTREQESNAEAIARWKISGNDPEGELVKVIREWKPDIIITFDPDRALGHCNHRATGFLATAAFRDAANPAKFSEQLNGAMKTWQVQRLYYSCYRTKGADDKRPDELIPSGERSPKRGKTYAELALEARAQHPTQFDPPPPPAPGRAARPGGVTALVLIAKKP